MTTLTQALAEFTTGNAAESLDDRSIEAAKATISDCIACMVAGAATEAGGIVRRVARNGAAPGAATLAGSPDRLTPQAAALANGTAAHALDYDDILWTLYGHPSVTVLPAAMAVAEAGGASGLDLIRAYCVGLEVCGKLGRAVNPMHYEHGWHATATIGILGATAACARLMRLDARQTAMALGTAASSAAGVRRNFGTMTKPFHAGNAGRGAVLAAELAREGFTSDLTALEGEFGWLATLQARSVPRVSDLAASLGKPWEVLDPGVVIKRYAACGGTHCALDALLAIRDEHQLAASDFERIVCVASPFAKKVLLYPKPQSGLEGKFSMEFSLAIAALEGRAGPAQYEDHWVTDPRILALLERTSFDIRDDLAPAVSADAVPAEVTVHARGRTFTRKVLFPSGDPRNAISTSQRRDKFMGCTEGLLPPGEAVELFGAFEQLERAAQLSALLAPLQRIAVR